MLTSDGGSDRCQSDADFNVHTQRHHPCVWRPNFAGLGMAMGRRCASVERLHGGMNVNDELRFNNAWEEFIEELKSVLPSSEGGEAKAVRPLPLHLSSISSSSSSSLSEVLNTQVVHDTMRKVVRFADANDLELVSIRYFERSNENLFQPVMDSPPKGAQLPIDSESLPPFVYVSGKSKPEHNQPVQRDRGGLAAFNQPFISTFQMPRFLSNFHTRLMSQNVVLESATAFGRSVSGTVCVRELGHVEKQVSIRESHNEWDSFTDYSATYITDSFDGLSSRFSFIMVIQPHGGVQHMTSLQFAIRYITGGQEYWDNHYGRNYVFLIPFRPDIHVRVPKARLT